MEINLSTTPAQYIASKGWGSKSVDGGNIAVSPCPFCGDAGNHFRIHSESGLYGCYKCGNEGNLITLLREQGDLREYLPKREEQKKVPLISDDTVAKRHAALMSNADALNYFRQRGFTTETIVERKLGYVNHPKLGPMVGYPVYAEGKCWFIKWRTITGKKTFRREPEGAPSVLFNHDVAKPGHPIILAEGEADAIALHQFGFKNVVGTTTGATGFDASWAKMLSKCSKVYICYDGDEAGEVGAEKIATRIGAHKCYKVTMPQGMDASEYLAVNGAAGFQSLIDGAKAYGSNVCLTAQDVWEARVTRIAAGEEPSVYTGISWWDTFVGPLHKAGYYLLAGYAGTGKTTLCLNLLWAMGRQQKKAWYVCYEMPAEEIMESVSCHVLKKSTLTDQDWVEALAKIHYTGVRFYDPKVSRTWKENIALIKDTVRENGIDVLFIDNFHFLTRVAENQNGVEGEASKEIKALSQECNIPVIVVHHLKKPESGDEPEPNIHSLRGASGLINDCSGVIILHHPLIKGDEESDYERHPHGYIKYGKPRHGKGGKRFVFANRELRTYELSNAEEYREATKSSTAVPPRKRKGFLSEMEAANQ